MSLRGVLSNLVSAVSGNLTFTSTAQRITGDMSNATMANRLMFQNSVTNGATQINAIPNGTSQTSLMRLMNNSDPTNSSAVVAYVDAARVGFDSGIVGSGSYLRWTAYAGGSERLGIDPTTGFVTVSSGALGRGTPVTKTADFTLAATENWIINNKSGSSCTVTLPAASSWTGREVTIKTIQAQTVVSASSNVVPLAGGAAGTAILAATAGKWATLVSDGTNWVIMAGN